MSQILAVDQDLALGRQLVTDEQLDQRRLARAGRANEEDEIALRHQEIDLAQGDVAVGIGLRDVMQQHDRPIRRSVVSRSGWP